MRGRGEVSRRNRNAEKRRAAGQVSDTLMLKAWEPDCIDHAGDERERRRTEPDPSW